MVGGAKKSLVSISHPKSVICNFAREKHQKQKKNRRQKKQKKKNTQFRSDARSRTKKEIGYVGKSHQEVRGHGHNNADPLRKAPGRGIYMEGFPDPPDLSSRLNRSKKVG
jgi:hypothetical protein